MISERLLKSLNLTLFSDFHLFISENFPFYEFNNRELLLERLKSDIKELTIEDKLHFFEYILDKKELENYLQFFAQFKDKYKNIELTN